MTNLFAGATTDTYLALAGVILVLILVCVNTSILKRLSAMQSAPAAKVAKAAAVDNTIAQIAQKEELANDLELVAVITAAIAASEGATSTNGFVVRSIRRAGSNWKNA